MAKYRLFTVWRVNAPLRDVWDTIHDATRWPQWWKNVERFSVLQAGDDDGLGAIHRYTWKGALPYRLTLDILVTRVEPLVALEGKVTGALEGIGRWHFSADGADTVVRYDW